MCTDSSAIRFYNYYQSKLHSYYEQTNLDKPSSFSTSVVTTIIGEIVTTILLFLEKFLYFREIFIL